jgi:tripeptide aminopeptidase
MLDFQLQAFLLKEAKERFLRYVQIDTPSDPNSQTFPSTVEQIELARRLQDELTQLQIADTHLDQMGYVYATVPASEGAKGPPITFCSHMDTSPAENGAGVKPVMHENYDGGPIRFPANPELLLDPEQAPQLLQFVGQTIITADGRTLLGADDKAGLAEIMAALGAMQHFDLPHPELRIVFTPDEEIGQGVDHIDVSRLGTYGYTMDGGMLGELEQECFDAWEATLVFHGKNIHPGYAKGKMINAGAIAARLISALPEAETPEHTEKREGFYHLTEVKGNENSARIQFILRDFDKKANARRMEMLKRLVHLFELRYPGLKIDLAVKDQYDNMHEVLVNHPRVIAYARRAIEAAGLTVIEKPIRGGTDGARLSFMGMPTPNIFTGGMMFHSKTEWIPEIALQKGAEVILHLCRLWAEAGADP